MLGDSDKREAVPLDYEEVPPRSKRVPGFNGWWVVLALLPVFIYSHPGIVLSTSNPYTRAKQAAAIGASLAIGLRAVVGIIRRERTWAWLIYLNLYWLLGPLTRLIANYAFKLGW